MEVIARDLVQVLVAQHALYDQLIGLLEIEQGALLSRQPGEALDVVRRKETLLLKIRTLDESRQIICQRLARRLGLPATELTITEIRSRLDPAQAESLADIQRQLRDTMERLKAMNERTNRLCSQGMDVVRDILRAVSRQENPGDAYGPRAGVPAPRHNNGNLRRQA
jgi:flagellar biosynthesis/type III secretory pathway chaperone